MASNEHLFDGSAAYHLGQYLEKQLKIHSLTFPKHKFFRAKPFKDELDFGKSKKGKCKECEQYRQVLYGWCEACWENIIREICQDQIKMCRELTICEIDGVEILNWTKGFHEAVCSSYALYVENLGNSIQKVTRELRSGYYWWGTDKEAPPGIELMPAQRSWNLDVLWQDTT